MKFCESCSQRDREQDSYKILEFDPLYQSYWWGGGGGALHLCLLFCKIVYGSRFYRLKGGYRILIKHEIRKFIVSTVRCDCREQSVTKKPNKLKNCTWFLK